MKKGLKGNQKANDKIKHWKSNHIKSWRRSYTYTYKVFIIIKLILHYLTICIIYSVVKVKESYLLEQGLVILMFRHRSGANHHSAEGCRAPRSMGSPPWSWCGRSESGAGLLMGWTYSETFRKLTASSK